MKTALITGASSGIGKELAIVHAKNGGDLVVIARRKEALENLKYSLQDQYGVHVEVIVQDLLIDDAAQLVFDTISSRKINIDYLINNAGFGDNQLFKNSDPGRNQMMMQLNMNALVELSHLYTSHWIENKISGKIMNVASTAAFQAVPYFTLFAATMAFVLSFSEGLSLELKGDNITVTALCPGPTKTEFAANSNMDQELADHKMLPTAEEVARFGYKRMLRGNSVAVHGILNKAGTASGKMFPRKLSAYVAGQIMKKAGKH